MALKEYCEFYAPTKLMYGYETSLDAGKEAADLGAEKVMIITDKVVAGAGLVDKVKDGLETYELDLVEFYDGVPVNSEIDVCKEIAGIGKDKGVDTIISVGGGSVIDTAKGANILLGVGGDLLEDWQGTHLVPEPLKNHIAIPTTAGTGAEVSLGAVIKDTAAGQKISFNSKYLLPNVAILDPSLSVSMPPGLTAATGIDALTHAVESFTSLEHAIFSDAFSFMAVKTVFDNLRTAFEDGEDLEARGSMLLAASLGGMALSTTMSIGGCHAMAHAAGGLSPVSHGVANAIILPVMMEYNLEYCPDRYAELAPAVGINAHGMDELEAAKAVTDAIADFIISFGLPQTLKEAGADRAMAERMASEAMGDGQMYANPREADEEEITDLFFRLL